MEEHGINSTFRGFESTNVLLLTRRLHGKPENLVRDRECFSQLSDSQESGWAARPDAWRKASQGRYEDVPCLGARKAKHTCEKPR